MASLLQINSWMFQWSKKTSVLQKKKHFHQKVSLKNKSLTNKKLKIAIKKYVRSTIKLWMFTVLMIAKSFVQTVHYFLIIVHIK
jgi:hypothetical protein